MVIVSARITIMQVHKEPQVAVKVLIFLRPRRWRCASDQPVQYPLGVVVFLHHGQRDRRQGAVIYGCPSTDITKAWVGPRYAVRQNQTVTPFRRLGYNLVRHDLIDRCIASVASCRTHDTGWPAQHKTTRKTRMRLTKPPASAGHVTPAP